MECDRVKIDIEDIDKVKNHKWNLNKNKYAETHVNNKIIFLHNLIMNNIDKKFVTDHINRDRLDNRKENLRLVTYQQNGMNKGKQSNNTSGYVGVSWDKSRNKWESHIKINRKKKHLGYFTNIEDAVFARKQAEDIYFGEYKCINPDINTVFKKIL